MPAADMKSRERSLFGHPIGLSFLFTTEMAERFCYYGMTAILVYYLTEQLLLPGHTEHVWGYLAVKGAYESVLGRLSAEEFASNIAGLYTGLVYLTPFFGGMLADRVWGQRYTVIGGGVLMAIGEFMLVDETLFFPGLLLMIIGNGGFKPNISTQVGNLYQPGDSRIDRAYSIFYVGINIGATLAPLICGTLGEEVAWRWGFFAGGVGLTLGVIVYLFGLRTLPPDRVTRARREGTKVARAPLTRQDWKAIIAIVVLLVPTTLFWAAYQQQSITILFWARDFTDRTLIPGLSNFQIPATWSQSVNPFMIFAFTPVLIWYWARQARRGTEPLTIDKMVIGCALLTISFVIMAAVAWMVGPHGRASWAWLLVHFSIYTVGELYLSPIGLALVARVAPPQVLSMMMGAWFVSNFIGNTLAGYMGGFWDQMSKPKFFLLIAALGAASVVITWLLRFPLKPILHRDEAPAAPAEPVAGGSTVA